jgi:hypothetical protein
MILIIEASFEVRHASHRLNGVQGKIIYLGRASVRPSGWREENRNNSHHLFSRISDSIRMVKPFL